MARIRHRPENSPSRYRGVGVSTEPGEVVEVGEETAEHLLTKPWFELVDANSVEDDDDGDDLGQLTKDELLELAREEDITGRSSMTKSELIAALEAEG